MLLFASGLGAPFEEGGEPPLEADCGEETLEDELPLTLATTTVGPLLPTSVEGSAFIVEDDDDPDPPFEEELDEVEVVFADSPLAEVVSVVCKRLVETVVVGAFISPPEGVEDVPDAAPAAPSPGLPGEWGRWTSSSPSEEGAEDESGEREPPEPESPPSGGGEDRSACPFRR